MQIESVWWDEQHECNVITVKMPSRVPGAVTVAEDGTYVMLINADKVDEQRKCAYRHECQHIEDDDLYSSESVGDIECRTHRKAA